MDQDMTIATIGVIDREPCAEGEDRLDIAALGKDLSGAASIASWKRRSRR